MNRKNLDQIFTAYIDKFQFLNDKPQEESYKWSAVVRFQKVFDLDAPDFVGMLKEAKRATRNMIDSINQPLGGLIELAKEEPDTVREMLRALLQEDGGDLTVRQEKITAFLRDCDALLEKYFPGSFLYKNDQRSAMAYLFFHDPDDHYLYKAKQASYFSDRVGFMDDWGPMTDFRLDVYYRFCDELIREIKSTPALLATHASRFENTTAEMYPDKNLHLLLFDILYCTRTYDLCTGLALNNVTTAERRLYQENQAKAQTLLAAVQKAEADSALLQEARHYFTGLLAQNPTVTHKSLGGLDVVNVKDDYVTVTVQKTGERKVFQLLPSIANGFLKIEREGFAENAAKYRPVMLRAQNIPQNVLSAQKALQPYLEYLD